MNQLPSSEGVLKKVLGHGYQIHPEALKILESLDDEKAIEVLSSVPEKFPDAIVIEVKHVERILGNPAAVRFFCSSHQ